MEYSQTYKNIDVFATLTESVCKIITEIRTAKKSFVITSAAHILFVLLIVLSRRSAGETGNFEDDELKKYFGHIKKSVTGCSELKKLTHAADSFRMYRRFVEQIADDWNEIAKRCMLAADPDFQDIIEKYGIEAAADTFDDMTETLDMLDTPKWDEAFEYLAAN